MILQGQCVILQGQQQTGLVPQLGTTTVNGHNCNCKETLHTRFCTPITYAPQSHAKTHVSYVRADLHRLVLPHVAAPAYPIHTAMSTDQAGGTMRGHSGQARCAALSSRVRCFESIRVWRYGPGPRWCGFQVQGRPRPGDRYRDMRPVEGGYACKRCAGCAIQHSTVLYMCCVLRTKADPCRQVGAPGCARDCNRRWPFARRLPPHPQAPAQSEAQTMNHSKIT